MKSTYIDEEVYKYLLTKYNKLMLNKEELAYELGVSVSSINNYIVQGKGVPDFVKGDAKNSKVSFSIYAIARYISNHSVKVA